MCVCVCVRACVCVVCVCVCVCVLVVPLLVKRLGLVCVDVCIYDALNLF